MIGKTLFSKNLNKNYKIILGLICLLLFLYNFLSFEISGIISLKVYNQAFNMEGRFRMTLVTAIFEIICMILIVLTNLLEKTVLRKICWYILYITCFSILLFVFKRTYVDLAFYYLILVWVESNLFRDYSLLDFND